MWIGDYVRHLSRELGDHELVQADAFSFGFSLKCSVQRLRQADDELAALSRCCPFNESATFGDSVKQPADSLVFLRFQECRPLLARWICLRNQAADRVEQRI